MKNKNIFEVSATVFLFFMPNRQTKHLWLFKQIKFLSLSGSFIHLRALKTCWLKHVCSYCFCFFCYKFTDNQLAFKMSMGDSRILATSKATLPCPNMTAVSQLRSGLSWRKKSNRRDRSSFTWQFFLWNDLTLLRLFLMDGNILCVYVKHLLGSLTSRQLGSPLYQPTKSLAEYTPAKSSPGTPMLRFPSAP